LTCATAPAIGLPVRSAKEITNEVIPILVLQVVNLSGVITCKRGSNTYPISLRSLENDAAAGVTRDMTEKKKKKEKKVI